MSITRADALRAISEVGHMQGGRERIAAFIADKRMTPLCPDCAEDTDLCPALQGIAGGYEGPRCRPDTKGTRTMAPATPVIGTTVTATAYPERTFRRRPVMRTGVVVAVGKNSLTLRGAYGYASVRISDVVTA